MASQSHVAAAVEPSRAAAVERARIEARALASRIWERYEQDPTIGSYARRSAFPHTTAYEIYRRNYTLLGEVTATTDGGKTRTPAPEKVERFVADAAKEAELAYTSFIAKLEKKVGECDSATLEGDHVWGHSTLIVVKGEQVERWRTQQIVNVSKLGRPFNQWPTRKLK